MTWAIVTVCGHLGAKPTIKHFDSGNMVCNFVLYVDPSKRNDEDSSVPMKLRVEVWGKQAETCMNLLDKGSRATVHGTLDEETYQDREGNPASQLRIRFAQVLDYGFKPNSERAAETASETPV